MAGHLQEKRGRQEIKYGAKAPLQQGKELKLADKPGFVGFIAKADSHSSRRTITRTLKQPTRWQREPRLIYLRKNASLFGLAADGGYRVSP